MAFFYFRLQGEGTLVSETIDWSCPFILLTVCRKLANEFIVFKGLIIVMQWMRSS
jgi:hypothetical protein